MTKTTAAATTAAADNQLHAFRTFLGLPPDSDTAPACGAVLSAAYNGRGKPECRICAGILRRERAIARRDHRRAR
jgi:hypothetical protein